MTIRRTNNKQKRFNRFFLISLVIILALFMGGTLYILKLIGESQQTTSNQNYSKTDSILVNSKSLLDDPLTKADSGYFNFSLKIQKDTLCIFEGDTFPFYTAEEYITSTLDIIENKETLAVSLEIDRELPAKYLAHILDVLAKLKVKVILKELEE